MARLLVLLAAVLSVMYADDNLTSVYQWEDYIDFQWPAGKSGESQKVEPKYMAVYGHRIFLSLSERWSAHVTLVSLPNNETRKWRDSPNMTAYPSYEANKAGDCSAVQQAQGLEVDAEGRLWVLDRGDKAQDRCQSKLWIFDLADDSVALSFQFSEWAVMLTDLVLDRTDDDWLAYIANGDKLLVFSLRKKGAWHVEAKELFVGALALSPAEEVKKLYLTDSSSGTFHSVSLNALRAGNRNAQISKLNSTAGRDCYRMLADTNGFIYAAFSNKMYLAKLDSRNKIEPFKKEITYKEIDQYVNSQKYAFALDSSGYFWTLIMSDSRPRWGTRLTAAYELAKFQLGARSYVHTDVKACPLTCNQGRGVCLKSGYCRCRAGWWGTDCEICFPLPGCVHGTCAEPWQCNCDAGWQGKLCDKAVCSEGCSQEHGFCENPGDCTCRDGWQGKKCDQCKAKPGCLHGTCHETGQCECNTGWTGPLCDKAICAKTCNASHGFCNEPGECLCKVGWQGSDCDACHPYPGCVNGSCDRPWECKCQSGWEGIFCDQELTYCEDHDIKCENGGKCVSLSQRDGNFRCETARNVTQLPPTTTPKAQ